MAKNGQKGQREYILPRAYTYNKDLSKHWFVYYYFMDPDTGKMKRFKNSKGINERDTVEKRIASIYSLTHRIKKKMLAGWNPFKEQETASYENRLEYQGKNNKVTDGAKTLDFHLSKFLEQKSCRPATYTSYKSKFRYFKKYMKSIRKGKIFMYRITRENADGFIQYLKTERKLKNKTINDYVVLLKVFFSNAIKEGACNDNVFGHMKKLKEYPRRPRIFTKDIIEKVVKVMKKDDPQMYLAVQIMYNCFIRPGELRYLKISDIDLTYGTIRVPAEVSKVGKQRIVVIPDHLLIKIRDHLVGNYPEDYYIISKKGHPWEQNVSRNYMYYKFVGIKEKVGISKEYILYAWKHTGMVELKRSGADWLAVRNQAGHASLDQTIAYTTELMGDCESYIKSNAPSI